MKKMTLFLIGLFVLNIATSQSLTKDERKSAIKYLKWSSKELYKSLKGLNAAQLNFKSSADTWSAQDCLYHIAFSEGALRGALDGSLSLAPDKAAKAELKATDDQIKSNITDRSSKFKTAAPFEPLNTGFKSYTEAMAAYKAKRALLMEFAKVTSADLRNQIVTLPFGKMDAYQFILFIAGHTNRHTQQIEEVKAATGYPKI